MLFVLWLRMGSICRLDSLDPGQWAFDHRGSFTYVLVETGSYGLCVDLTLQPWRVCDLQ